LQKSPTHSLKILVGERDPQFYETQYVASVPESASEQYKLVNFLLLSSLVVCGASFSSILGEQASWRTRLKPGLIYPLSNDYCCRFAVTCRYLWPPMLVDIAANICLCCRLLLHRCMCMFIVLHATLCLCMFLVAYPQTHELLDWHKLTYLVLTCRKTPINQLAVAAGNCRQCL